MKAFFETITNGRLRTLAKPILAQFIQSVLQGQPYFVILFVILELIRPITDAGRNPDLVRLWWYVAWLGASLALLFFTGRWTYRTEHSAAYSVAAEGRLALGDHLRRLSMGFFRGRDPGDITALMLQDYSNIEMMVSHLLMDAIGAVVTPLLFLAFLLPFNWRMALITVAPIPLALLAAIVTRRVVMFTGNRHIAAKNDASARMLEYLDGIKNIKAHNLYGSKFQRLKRSFEHLKRMSIRVEATGGPFVITGVWILNVGIALIMLFGISFVINGTLGVSEFLVFLIVATRMYDPLSKVLITFVELSYFSISAGRVRAILQTRPLPVGSTSHAIRAHDIEFSSVRFRYHDKDVLTDVSFRSPQNSMTALVGHSGSGKSTITRLIARFWDVDDGEVTIGGVPVGAIAAEELMSMISMVFQDVYLFNDTIENNIRVGKTDASMEEIVAAVQRARCHDFIEELPDGYATMVGEGGATLSGGEKQRISIARAILKDAPIVLLDEATASLDPENELFIQQAIDELIRGRTLVVIAHRLSTITHADQIVVLKEGVIVERGTHSDLLQDASGVYRTMWDEQRSAHQWKVASAGRLSVPAE